MRLSSLLIVLMGSGMAGGSVYAARGYIEAQADVARESGVARCARCARGRGNENGGLIVPGDGSRSRICASPGRAVA